MTETTRIAAIDDHPLFLSGLKRAIGRSAEFKLVAEGACADDALRIATTEKPEIMLLDIGIPGDGIEAARSILARQPEIKIAMLTASEDDEHVAAALAAGARGYVVKGSTTSEVVQALRSVRDGQNFVTPAIASRVLSNKLRAPSVPAEAEAADAKLNTREQQVMDFVAQGLSNKEIAAELGLTVHTVKNYMSRILSKMRVSNRVRAASKFRPK